MKQKPIQVTRSSMPPIEDYVSEIADLWDSRWLSNSGAKHNALEERLADYLQVPFISLFSNGHTALECILEALDLTGEVITTPFTFISTTNAIVRNGLKPVFCDVNARDFTIDVTKIEPLITARTTAILPVHVYGNVCDVQSIEAIAAKYNLKVVYDAAHAFGVRLQDKGVGQFGDASMFSFHATKVFHTVEGGGITCNGKSLYERLKAIKNHGLAGKETAIGAGTNAKMSEFHAAMGLCNLKYLDQELGKRKLLFERYRERLSGISGIRLNPEQKYIHSNYAYFPVIIEEKEFGRTRDAVYEELQKEEIYSRRYFYPLTNVLLDLESLAVPVAAALSERVLSLPVYADLKLEEVDRICDILIELLKR